MSQARVFQCPSCKEFISTDATSCRFCKAPIDASVAATAADAQSLENKRERKKGYAKHMMTGGGILALGLIVTIGSYAAAAASAEGGSYVITWGLVLAGAGDFLYGLWGWLGELKK
jgi:hypothetical protein